MQIILIQFLLQFYLHSKNKTINIVPTKTNDMTLKQEIQQIKQQLVYNRKRNFKRAWYLFKKGEFKTLGEAISFVCAEVRKYRAEKRILLAQLEESLIIRTRERWSVQPTPSFIQTQAYLNGSIIK